MQIKKTFMLKNRLFISYVSTAFLYLFFAVILFYVQNTIMVTVQNPKEQVLCMSLKAFVPEPVAPVEQLEQEETIEEPLPEEKPEVKEEPKVEEELVVEEKPVVKPQPIVKKPTPVIKQAKKKPQVKKTTKAKVAKEKQAKQKASSRPATTSPAEQNKFLAAIRAKINQHKSYPRMAKKRGLQGTVTVTFTILPSGSVGNISAKGPKAFHGSAQEAVRSAFPIDVRKSPLILPATISIALQYKIR